MRSRLGLVALVAVGLALLGWAIFARETDEEAIRRRLDAISAAVAIVPDEGIVPRAGRVKSGLVESVEKQATISIPEVGERVDRETLIGAAVGAGQRWRTGELGWSDVTITVRGETASVDATAKLTATGGGQPRSDERKVALDLRKADGEWIVTGVVVSPSAREEAEEEE
jgi:hypothetical protein